MIKMQVFDIEIKLLMEAIYLKYKYDFRQYNIPSIHRRLKSALIEFNIKTISGLQEKILHEPDFFTSMLQYLTIPTTEMFRHPEYFKAFRQKVVPHLRTYPSIKIWIAGCSTGQEAYSFAIALKEEGLLDRTMIYSTDINPVSLKKAQEAAYPIDELEVYENNYLHSGGSSNFSDYFSIQGNYFLIDPELKKGIIFADHSLATDTVFSEMQFISCRNVLIYFNKDLQNRAFSLFHDSLCLRGFLGIGAKESMKFSSKESSFEDWALKERIYRRLN